MPSLFSFTQTTRLPTPSKPWSSLPADASHCSVSVCIQLFRKCLQVQILASGQSSLLSAVLPGNPCGLAKRACKKLGHSRKVLRPQRLDVDGAPTLCWDLQVRRAVCSPSPSWLACLCSPVLPLGLEQEGTSSGAKLVALPKDSGTCLRGCLLGSPVLDQSVGHTKTQTQLPKGPTSAL